MIVALRPLAFVVACTVLVPNDARAYSGQGIASLDAHGRELEMVSKKTTRKKSVSPKRPRDEAPPTIEAVHDALRAALATIRDLAFRGRGAPQGLGFFLESYLAAPSRVDLVLGDLLAKRRDLESYRPTDERGAVVRELLESADRLVYRANAIAGEGAPIPTETERRRLRIPEVRGKKLGPTDRDTLRREGFLRFAQMCGRWLDHDERHVREVVGLDLTADELKNVLGFAIRELAPVDRPRVTSVALILEVGAAWNADSPGAPANDEKSKSGRLADVLKIFGLSITPASLKACRARMAPTTDPKKTRQ